MYWSLVVRYTCEAESSNAYGSEFPERVDTKSIDSDVFKSDASLMVSVADLILKPPVQVVSAC